MGVDVLEEGDLTTRAGLEGARVGLLVVTILGFSPTPPLVSGFAPVVVVEAVVGVTSVLVLGSYGW